MKKLLTFIVCVVALVGASGCMTYDHVIGSVYVTPIPVIVVQPYYHYHYGYPHHW